MAGRLSPRADRCRGRPPDHGRETMTFHVDSEVGQPPPGAAAHARAVAEAAHPHEQGRLALRRRAVGAARAGGARGVPAGAARPRRRPSTCWRDLLRETIEIPEARKHILDDDRRRALLRPAGHRRHPQRARRDGLRRRSQLLPDRRHHQARDHGAGLRPQEPRLPHARAWTTSSCRRCPTTCSPATPPAGSTTASRSTRCARRPGKRETVNCEAVYRCHPMFAPGYDRPARAATTSGCPARRSRRPPSRAATCWSSAGARCWSG